MLSEVVIKFASSGAGKRTFRDLRSEMYVSSEDETSIDGQNGRLIALK